jgi:deoxyribose-phosphate aldolase
MTREFNKSHFAKLFDHSIVRPNATREEVRRFAETAARLNTATLTVQPHYICFAAEILKGSGVLLGTTVGFPHGNETPSMKEYQAREVIDLGAEEIDMVMNIPALKNGEQELFIRDIAGVVRAAEGMKVKVILENCFLTQEEKRRAVTGSRAGAAFVRLRLPMRTEGPRWMTSAHVRCGRRALRSSRRGVARSTRSWTT